MAKKSLLEEAIAEAKQVRQAAIHNAVKQLEENLTPSIKEALANQLEEELDESDVEEESLEEAANSGFTEVKPKAEKKLDEADEEDAEAEEEKADDDEAKADAEEAEADDDEDAAKDDEADAEAEKEKAKEDKEDAEAEEEPSDDDSISDLTVGQLKDMILGIIATANPTPAPEGDMGADMEAADVEGAGEEEAPIEGDEAAEEVPADVPAEDAENDENDEEIDLAEILKELEEEFMATDKRGKEHDKPSGKDDICQDREIQELKDKLAAKEKELEEVNSKVTELAESIKSTNLLNSKLLYTSRILSQRNLNLSDEQKATVIKTLDEAKSPKEVKASYKTLCESFKSSRDVLKEGRRFASRSAGRSTAATNNVIPVDDTVRRMQQLAGIIE